MRLIAVGKLRAGPERALFDRYNARLRPALGVIELPEGIGAPLAVKRKEGAALLAALPSSAFAVALDVAGAAPGSEGLAASLACWRAQPRPLCFVIGGAEGLDGAVVARADHLLSLGPMTWPHMLVRVLLAEQLYRAQSILSGHPYHRPGRPG
ncbi:MAG: 23S rRNA (pseudouridine(1915)-N(3))-methyltransferase RlmH [Acetobacteraceae bacterium]|nr:23S rRNA (pseudouridine(1915)-N(3))-methyltransferase RlmH [Acetobacteraceae bacterium]